MNAIDTPVTIRYVCLLDINGLVRYLRPIALSSLHSDATGLVHLLWLYCGGHLFEALTDIEWSGGIKLLFSPVEGSPLTEPPQWHLLQDMRLSKCFIMPYIMLCVIGLSLIIFIPRCYSCRPDPIASKGWVFAENSLTNLLQKCEWMSYFAGIETVLLPATEILTHVLKTSLVPETMALSMNFPYHSFPR